MEGYTVWAFEPQRYQVTEELITSIFLMAYGDDIIPIIINDYAGEELYEEDEEVRIEYDSMQWLYDFVGEMYATNRGNLRKRIIMTERKTNNHLSSEVRQVVHELPTHKLFVALLCENEVHELGSFGDGGYCYHSSPDQFGQLVMLFDGCDVHYAGVTRDRELTDRLGSCIFASQDSYEPPPVTFNNASISYTLAGFLHYFHMERPRTDEVAKPTMLMAKVNGVIHTGDTSIQAQDTTPSIMFNDLEDLIDNYDSNGAGLEGDVYTEDERVHNSAYCGDCGRVYLMAEYAKYDMASDPPTYEQDDHMFYSIAGEKDHVCSCTLEGEELAELHYEVWEERIEFNPWNRVYRPVGYVPDEQLTLFPDLFPQHAVYA